MGSFEFGPNLRKTGIYRGLIAKLAKLHLIEGPIAKMHVTTVISSSNYPKNIYGKPLFERWSKSDLNLNSNSNLKLNRKEKEIKKRITEGLGHMGQPRALGPNSTST